MCARALLRHFGSLKRIRAASAEEIAQVKGINRDLAAAVRRDLDEITAVLDSEERAEESASREVEAGGLASASEANHESAAEDTEAIIETETIVQDSSVNPR